MSRVGKAPVTIPAGVEVTLAGHALSVKGAKGTLNYTIPADVIPELVEDAGVKSLVFKPVTEQKRLAALWGTTRANVANLVQGVHSGFTITLKLVGVGYRAQAQGNKLNLSVGYSHPVGMEAPAGVSVVVNENTEVVISGADKQQVGQFAANVRAVRPPEPFKGKGIRYTNEHIVMKEGKKK